MSCCCERTEHNAQREIDLLGQDIDRLRAQRNTLTAAARRVYDASYVNGLGELICTNHEALKALGERLAEA